MKTRTEELVMWASYLSRLSRRPRTFKQRPSLFDTLKTDQECARRRAFYKVHGTAIGGGRIWPG